MLPNISANIAQTRNGNQIMNFSHLIENKMRNIFLKNSYTKYGRETISRFFSKNSKLSIYLNQYPKVLYGLFLFYATLRSIKIY